MISVKLLGLYGDKTQFIDIIADAIEKEEVSDQDKAICTIHNLFEKVKLLRKEKAKKFREEASKIDINDFVWLTTQYNVNIY